MPLSPDFCLSCGTDNVEIIHPLFKGSLCFKCKVWFKSYLTFVVLNHKMYMLLSFAGQNVIFHVQLCICVGELYRDAIQVWWGWLSVILHCVLCWTRGHSLWKRQLLQVWTQTYTNLNLNVMLTIKTECFTVFLPFSFCSDVSVKTVWMCWWDRGHSKSWRRLTHGAVTFACPQSAMVCSSSGLTGVFVSRSISPITVPLNLWVSILSFLC